MQKVKAKEFSICYVFGDFIAHLRYWWRPWKSVISSYSDPEMESTYYNLAATIFFVM